MNGGFICAPHPCRSATARPLLRRAERRSREDIPPSTLARWCPRRRRARVKSREEHLGLPHSQSVVQAIVRHPAMTPEMLTALGEAESDEEPLTTVLAYPRCPEKMLRSCAQGAQPMPVSAAARVGTVWVVAPIVEHPHAPSDVLEQLASKADSGLCRLLLCNRSLPETAFLELMSRTSATRARSEKLPDRGAGSDQ